MVQLMVNGDTLEVPETVTNVSQLLAHFGLADKVAIVELNQEILAKDDHLTATIAHGDRIEIVHFVGGG